MTSSISASAAGVIINGDNLTIKITADKLVVNNSGGRQSNGYGWSVTNRFVVNGKEHIVTGDTTITS